MEKIRTRALVGWLVLWLLWLALVIQPESRGILRLAVVVLFVVQAAGALLLFWRRKAIRYAVIGLVVLLVSVLALPPRAVAPAALREEYLHSLALYDGTTYVWGGENRLGIDCSGLVRKGFMVACLREGLRTFNGALVRKACSLWWYDASAEAMGAAYRDETKLLFETPALNTLDHSRLRPGDIAVTDNGVHTLVYVGELRWMQADPGRGRAQYETIPVTDSGWFSMPVRILRWRLLDEE